MAKPIYDFREGLEKENIVYKKKKREPIHGLYYFLYLMATWAWTVGWFALFLYAYTNHEFIAFWVYIAFWLAFAISFIIIATLNIMESNKKKKEKIKQEEIHVVEVIETHPNDMVRGQPQPVIYMNGDMNHNNNIINTISNERVEFIRQ